MCVCRLHWRIDVFISEYAGTCESYKEFYCPSVIWAPRNSGEGYGEYVWEVVVCIGLLRKYNIFDLMNSALDIVKLYLCVYSEYNWFDVAGQRVADHIKYRQTVNNHSGRDDEDSKYGNIDHVADNDNRRYDDHCGRNDNRTAVWYPKYVYHIIIHIFTSNDVLSLAKCVCATDHKKSRRLIFMSGSRIF